MPNSGVQRLHWLPGDYNVRIYMTMYVYPLGWTSETPTIWVTIMLVVNRYIMLCLPLRASQWCMVSKVNVQLAVVLVLAIVYSIPEFVRYRIAHHRPTRNNGTMHVVKLKIEGYNRFRNTTMFTTTYRML